MPHAHEDLMQQHLRDENLPEAVLPFCPISKVLKGQKALVTGANSGIGKAVALALAHAGADVVVNYVSRPEAAEEVVQEASRSGSRVYAHQADVRREDQVQAMFRKMIQEFGTVDILVNNAGLQKDAKIEDMTLEQWNTVIGVNLTRTDRPTVGAPRRTTSPRSLPRSAMVPLLGGVRPTSMRASGPTSQGWPLYLGALCHV